MNPNLTRHLLPFLSVLIAVTALLYSTWRNETTETQRSLRQAGFAVMERMTAFEGYVFILAYAERDERSAETPFLAWAAAREIRDLSAVLPAPIPAQAQALFEQWQENFNAISQGASTDAQERVAGREAADILSDDIQGLRTRIIQTVSAFQ